MIDDPDAADDLPRHHIRSLGRGLAVIRAFDGEHPRQTLSEVARSTGLSRAAARRFLLTLVDLGYVSVRDHRFQLTPKVLEIGYAYLSSVSLPQLAQRHLEYIAGEAEESASVSVLDDRDVIYIARVAKSRIMTVSINVGTRFPAYATSLGRAILAGLEPDELDSYLDRYELEALTPRTIIDEGMFRDELTRVREQGYALLDQELEPGLRSIAVPVRDPSHRVVAASNISTHSSRVPMDDLLERLLPILQEGTARIEYDLALATPR